MKDGEVVCRMCCRRGLFGMVLVCDLGSFGAASCRVMCVCCIE
jgi:hypothetical protein